MKDRSKKARKDGRKGAVTERRKDGRNIERKVYIGNHESKMEGRKKGTKLGGIFDRIKEGWKERKEEKKEERE